jgi:hypothetical protein
MVAPFCTIGKNTLLAELLTITIFFSGGWLGTTAPALPAKPRAKTKRTDINARDVVVTDLRRLSSNPVETVKVDWLPIDVSSVFPHDGITNATPLRGFSDQLGERDARSELPRFAELDPFAPSSALRKANRGNEKRIYLEIGRLRAGKPAG